MTKYHIVALGGPGSGKTVYMASLYHQLTTGQLVPGTSVKSSLGTTSWLNAAFKQLSDPDDDFPPGTNPASPMREVELRITCERMHRPWFFGSSRLISFPVLEVSYVDYSGEWITESDTQSQELLAQLEERLNDAHVVFAFLDGERIRRAIIEGDTGSSYIERELRPIINLAASQTTPIVLVLTKWDLLMTDLSLSQVVAALMADERTGLHGLTTMRSATSRITRRPVGGLWLVPVTATGPDFARWDHVSGRVVKTGRSSPQPINVTIPFTIGLTEIASVGLKELRQAANKVKLRTPSGLKFDEGAEIFSGDVPIGIGGVTLDLRRLLAFSGDLAIDTIQILSVPATRTARLMRRGYRKVAARGLDGVNSNEGAVMYFALALRKLFTEFKDEPSNSAAHLWADSEEWQTL